MQVYKVTQELYNKYNGVVFGINALVFYEDNGNYYLPISALNNSCFVDARKDFEILPKTEYVPPINNIEQ